MKDLLNVVNLVDLSDFGLHSCQLALNGFNLSLLRYHDVLLQVPLYLVQLMLNILLHLVDRFAGQLGYFAN